MAKLATQSTPGFNADRKHEPRKIRLDEIVIDPEISKIFDIQIKTKDAVLNSIQKRGYDPEQPVVIWAGSKILIDGHTRYAAAKAAGLEEIFAYERDFPSREDAILYAFGRQAIRRNLTSKDLVKAAQMIPDVRREKGQGRIAEEIAEMLGVSPSTVYQVRKIVKDGSPEDIEAVESGKASINSVYDKVAKKTKDTMELPELIKKTKPETRHLSQKINDNKDIDRLIDLLIMETLRQDRANCNNMTIESIAILPQITNIKANIISFISS
jgi:ParB-like chromosome segregation protein Spo0J